MIVLAVSWGVRMVASSRAHEAPGADGGVVVRDPSTTVQMWLPAFERRVGGEGLGAVSESDAVSAARSTSLIVASRWTYVSRIDAMRRVNPKLRVYVYTNMAAASAAESSGYAEALFAHDAQGRRVTTPYGLYLGDVDNPAWISTRIADCRVALARSGYDGCYLDNLGSGLLVDGYLSAPPVHAGTVKPWTSREWIDNSIAVWTRYGRELPNVSVIGNGADNGTRYFDPTAPSSKLVRAVHVVVAETFVRLPDAPIDAPVDLARWRRDVAMLRDAERRDATVLTLTIITRAAPAADVDRWAQFALATFLLGSDGGSLFAFLDESPSSRGQLRVPQPDLGAPRGDMRETGGTFRREFARGLVIANPSGAPVTVALDRPYRQLDGQVVSSVTLPAVSAAVLRS